MVPISPKPQGMEAWILEDENQIQSRFCINTFEFLNNTSGKSNEEATSKVKKEDILALNEFRAYLRETLSRKESSAPVSSSRMYHAFEEDVFNIDALKIANIKLSIIMGRKSAKNEWLRLELQ